MGELQREDKCDDGVDNVAVDVVDDSIDSDDDDDLTTDGNVTAFAKVSSVESTNFGNIEVKNSRDVHFGNNAFYQGPVTIGQVVYATNNYSSELFGGLPPEEDELKDVISQAHTRSQNTNGFVEPVKDKRIQPDKAGKCRLRRRHVIWMTTAGVGVVLVALLFIFLTGTHTSQAGEETPPDYVDPTPPSDSPTTFTRPFKLVTRNTWLAQPPTGPIDDLVHPVPYVIISHTESEPCNATDCSRRTRDIQKLHIQGNVWYDIAYNFLVGGDGSAYEGRGWDEVGAHSGSIYNYCSIGISFIGTFSTVHPPQRQIDVTLRLIEEGVRLGKIQPNYRLIMHHDVSPTFYSPGAACISDLLNQTQLKPHYSQEPVLTCTQIRETKENSKQNDTLNHTTVK